MKKILPILIITLALFLTGCEKNRLVCTSTNEVTNLKHESKYVFTFNGDSVKYATMTTVGTLLGDYNNKEAIAEYKEEAESAAKSYNATEGASASVSAKKNKVTFKIELDPSKLSEDDLMTYGLDLSKEELKEELEGIGYTCK